MLVVSISGNEFMYQIILTEGKTIAEEFNDRDIVSKPVTCVAASDDDLDIILSQCVGIPYVTNKSKRRSSGNVILIAKHSNIVIWTGVHAEFIANNVVF